MTGYHVLSEVICHYRKGKTHYMEEMKMTDKQLKQAKSQLPQGEKFSRAYSAYEGGIRLISKTADGHEFRYKVIFDADDNVRIERF